MVHKSIENSMASQKQGKVLPFNVPTKLYRIGEVVRFTPFTRQTIHNYTTMGLIQECDWTEGGHRLYDESVFERLAEIMELRKTKSLAQIRMMLKKAENSEAAGVNAAAS